MVGLDTAFTVAQNFIFGLNNTIRRKSSVFLAQAHRAAGWAETHTQGIGSFKLQTHQIPLEGTGIEVVMVSGKGTAGFHKLTHGQQGRVIHRILINIFPYLVEEFQPIKKLGILDSWMVASQSLIKMVVGVHQARDDHVT
ncbi:hypothetical protein SDC9_86075 [bioreactor metagenome]|uniref:Uncharacterized protein n=1 Tax=bioreactor metagenome TaxID=1076179 RepID=A0A644ZEY7_9ZZZZ